MRLDTSQGANNQAPFPCNPATPWGTIGAGPERDGYVAASWQRCLNDYGLQPEGQHEAPRVARSVLSDMLEANNRLLRIARMEMNSFYAQIGNSHNTLVLTDAQGLVLEQVCDPLQAREFESQGLAPGFIWDERHTGTNGPGTCLQERRAITVYRDEHFFSNFRNLICSAAPIWGPDGKLMAVLDASCFDCTDSRQSQLHTMLLVSMSARVIEQIYFASSFKDSWIVRFHSRAELVGMVHDAMLAVDEEGRVRGADSLAAGLLGRDQPANLIGHSVAELFSLSPAKFFSQARSMPCRIWAALGQAVGTRYFLSVRPPHRPQSASFLDGRSDEIIATATLPRANAATPVTAPAEGADYPVESERDPVMAYNIWCAEQVMNKGINILLQGATGTGKGTLAKAIHMRSNRGKKPFIAMCCAAIPESLAESELFGYEAGAFTGARSSGMRGKIMASHGGTLFLDEIGDMPLSLQARLLHVLEEKEVTPLGSTKAIAVDLHVLSASNQNLPELIEKGLFREDLYYRLNGITLSLPPLRERQDLEDLIVSVCCSENNNRATTIESAAMDCLLAYAWPGNLRELRNVVRTALALASDGTLRLERLQWNLRQAAAATLPTDFGVQRRAPAAMPGEATGIRPSRSAGDEDHADISALLRRHRWNISRAAEDLGISRNTLYRRMDRLGIPTPRTK